MYCKVDLKLRRGLEYATLALMAEAGSGDGIVWKRLWEDCWGWQCSGVVFPDSLLLDAYADSRSVLLDVLTGSEGTVCNAGTDCSSTMLGAFTATAGTI